VCSDGGAFLNRPQSKIFDLILAQILKTLPSGLESKNMTFHQWNRF
jgi:hypothetical protein